MHRVESFIEQTVGSRVVRLWTAPGGLGNDMGFPSIDPGRAVGAPGPPG